MLKKSYIKKAISLVLALTVSAVVFAGCKSKDGSDASNSSSNSSDNNAGITTTGNSDDFELVENQPIATIKIKGFGDVKIALFPDIAPKAVENFTTHAKNGYYDGVKFHRIIADFMIQGGDPKGNGTGGESIWGESFEDEFSDKAHNFTGALSMANSGANTNGSQFFIVKGSSVSEELMKANGFDTSAYSDGDLKKYKEAGGAPWLDGVHTVFGQVYEGLDVVGKIMEDTPSDEISGLAQKDVIIETIEISTYTKK